MDEVSDRYSTAWLSIYPDVHNLSVCLGLLLFFFEIQRHLEWKTDWSILPDPFSIILLLVENAGFPRCRSNNASYLFEGSENKNPSVLFSGFEVSHIFSAFRSCSSFLSSICLKMEELFSRTRFFGVFWKIFLKSVWKLNRNIDFERTAHRFCVDLKCRFWGFLTIPTKPNFLPHIFSPVWMTLMYAFHFFGGTEVFWDAVWLRLLEMRMDQIKERLTII